MHVGTSGWGYPSWQPGFYPAGYDRTAFLSFYAEHLDAVEERLAEAGAVRVGDMTGRAGWAYLRFRELRYGTEQLDRIASELRELARAHVETFAFFRHGERPDAPAAAVQVATACRLT